MDVQISEKSENQEVSVGNGVTEAETKSPEVSKVGGPRNHGCFMANGIQFVQELALMANSDRQI